MLKLAKNLTPVSSIWALVIWIIFCSVILSSSFARTESSSHIDFVIDLDGVLLGNWKGGEPGPEDFVIEAIDGRYRVSDGAGEFLQSLLDIPNARVSFFSGGDEKRNLEALRQVKLPNGRSALEICQGRFFSHQHLTEKSGKDLSIVAPDVDLRSAILIDDQEGYALKGQEKNMLWSIDRQLADYSGINSVGDLNRMLKETEGTPSASSESEDLKRDFLMDRNKLARARGIIAMAMETSTKRKISVVEALNQIQWISDHDYNSKLITDTMVYRKGARAMRATNSNFRLTGLQVRPSCRDLMNEAAGYY